MGGKIVVTGATSGLGLALVGELSRAGYTPILTGRDPVRVAELAAELGVAGHELDVSDASCVHTVCARIEREHGAIDGVINNAGIWLEGDFETCTPDAIRAVIDTNTTGTIFVTHAFLSGMLARGRGTVINTVSTGALYCRKTISVYAASKWAIRGFTGCLEVECAPKGVRVMGFYPGKIDTRMYETAGVDRDLAMAMSPAQGAAMVVAMLRDEGMVWSHVSGRSIADYV